MRCEKELFPESPRRDLHLLHRNTPHHRSKPLVFSRIETTQSRVSNIPSGRDTRERHLARLNQRESWLIQPVKMLRRVNMNAMRFSRKGTGAVLALAFGLAGGATGYGVARAKEGTGTHVHASLKLADPSEGPSKIGFAPIVKEVLPNVVNISSSKVVRTPHPVPHGMQPEPLFQL